MPPPYSLAMFPAIVPPVMVISELFAYRPAPVFARLSSTLPPVISSFAPACTRMPPARVAELPLIVPPAKSIDELPLTTTAPPLLRAAQPLISPPYIRNVPAPMYTAPPSPFLPLPSLTARPPVSVPP